MKHAPHPAVLSGQRTILHARDGLSALAESLNEHFVQAVETLEKVRQKNARVIVTGMGKSGHIARKIVATMASTGTPAQFVHPGEASHGDLGMITENDAVLAISNSGEAPELSDIIGYTRRFGIPLIAITSKPESTLAKHADCVLALPPVGEACPNGLAPTTSTTLTLALGDALAVALLERLGLTPEQFRVFHPGGRLGQRLKHVRDLMDAPQAVPLVKQGTTMADALLVMSAKNVGCVVVEGNTAGTFAGIITDGDLKRHMSENLLREKVDGIMTRAPKTITPDALAAEAVEIMLHAFKSPISSLIVAEGEKLHGLIRLQACLQAGVL